MALGLEVVGWHSTAVGVSDSSHSALGLTGKKLGWGEDHQKLLQLMMGPSSYSNKEDRAPSTITLDLLGGTSSSSSHEMQSQFLDLDPHSDPLPSGWEKRLDLRSGSIHFVNTFMGICTTVDPRKPLATLLPPSGADNREFPRWVASESQKVIRSSAHQLKREGLGKRQWMEERSVVIDDEIKILDEDESNNLELNLNLSTNNSEKLETISVCTLERVQRALERSQVREALHQTDGSSRSEGRPPWIAQPAVSATSSSSSSSSSFCARRFKSQKISHQEPNYLPRAAASVVAPEDSLANRNKKAPIVLTGCRRCLTYVMLLASDPVCPRCGATDSNVSFSPEQAPEVELKL